MAKAEKIFSFKFSPQPIPINTVTTIRIIQEATKTPNPKISTRIKQGTYTQSTNYTYQNNITVQFVKFDLGTGNGKQNRFKKHPQNLKTLIGRIFLEIPTLFAPHYQCGKRS